MAVHVLRRADHSSRGVLPTVVRRCMWSRNLKNEEAMTRVGSQRHRKKKWQFTCQVKCWYIQRLQSVLRVIDGRMIYDWSAGENKSHTLKIYNDPSAVGAWCNPSTCSEVKRFAILLAGLQVFLPKLEIFKFTKTWTWFWHRVYWWVIKQIFGKYFQFKMHFYPDDRRCQSFRFLLSV
jgi:hypothetical protein